MIRVDVETDHRPRSCVVAPSIRAAVLIAGGKAAGARVCFPIDPENFFVGAEPGFGPHPDAVPEAVAAADSPAPPPASAGKAGAT